MANPKYYYSPDWSYTVLQNALLDFYGAYDVGTNPTGVIFHSTSTTDTIFSCTALSNKVIKLTMAASNSYGYFGDAYLGSINVSNEFMWGGNYGAYAIDTYHVICCDNTLLINSLHVTPYFSKILLIGKLSDDNTYGLIGSVGHNNVSSCMGCFGYITNDYPKVPSQMYIDTIRFDRKTSNGSMVTQPILIYDNLYGYLQESTGELLTFKDIVSCSRAYPRTFYAGSNYFITSSELFTSSIQAISVTQTIYSSLLIENVVYP